MSKTSIETRDVAAPTGTPNVADREVSLLDPRGDALRDIGAVSPGVVPFGIFLGITAAAADDITAGLLGAGVVYAGSAQLATMTMLHLGSGLLAAVVGGVIVNARVLLYSVALEPWFRGQPLWFRLLAPHFILDQTYLSTIARPDYRGSVFRKYWAWLGGALLVVWTGAIGIGIVLGPFLPELPHLVLVATTMFLAMLISRLVSARSIIAALTAAATTVAAALVVPQLAVLVGTVAGVVMAVLARKGNRIR